jgi:hypothetical protein
MVCKHKDTCTKLVSVNEAECKCLNDPEEALYMQEGCWHLTKKPA